MTTRRWVGEPGTMRSISAAWTARNVTILTDIKPPLTPSPGPPTATLSRQQERITGFVSGELRPGKKCATYGDTQARLTPSPSIQPGQPLRLDRRTVRSAYGIFARASNYAAGKRFQVMGGECLSRFRLTQELSRPHAAPERHSCGTRAAVP